MYCSIVPTSTLSNVVTAFAALLVYITGTPHWRLTLVGGHLMPTLAKMQSDSYRAADWSGRSTPTALHQKMHCCSCGWSRPSAPAGKP